MLSIGGPVGFADPPRAGRLVAEHVLFYVKGNACKLGRPVSAGANGCDDVGGEGTFFCPNARNFQLGKSTAWTGTLLGGAKSIMIRDGAALTHKQFTGLPASVP